MTNATINAANPRTSWADPDAGTSNYYDPGLPVSSGPDAETSDQVDPPTPADPGLTANHVHSVALDPLEGRSLLASQFVDPQASPVSPDPASNIDMSGFTPDMILQYVQSRLSDIDGQISDLMGDVNAKKARSEQLRNFENAVEALNGVGGDNSNYNTQGLAGGDRSAENKIAFDRLEAAKAGAAPDIVTKLTAFQAAIMAPAGGSFVSAQSIQNELDWAKNELTSQNSDNEVVMMRLNMLVQQRSQIISSASNMQASINDGVKNVIGNMRA